MTGTTAIELIRRRKVDDKSFAESIAIRDLAIVGDERRPSKSRISSRIVSAGQNESV
jgi:hypothetical protein